MKKSLYVDIDGTLARFHDADKLFIEAMWTPGFYINLVPFENLIDGIKLFIKQHPDVEVNVLSAVLDTDPPFIEGEKNAWLDKYLPEINRQHRIYTRAGDDKSEYIDTASKKCFLIDDYNKNLYEFEAGGGTSIKFHNDINHRGLGEYGGSKGNLWQGEIINYNDAPEKICVDLESIIFGKTLEYKENYREMENEMNRDFIIEDNILIEYDGNSESVVIPDGIEVIDTNVFWNKEFIRNVNFPESVQTILSGAFADCTNLENLVLPKDLRTIEFNAFGGCTALESVKIPASVWHLHNQAFGYCVNLKNIDVDSDNSKYFSIDGVVYKYGRDYEPPELFCCPCGKTGELTIPENVKFICAEAFTACAGITTINMPNGLIAIGDGAFYNCTSIEKIVIPENTTHLGGGVFGSCTNLKSVTLPDNLKSMGGALFDECRNLSEIIVSDEALVRYCEEFNFLDEVFLTPCYEEIKNRYEALTQAKSVDTLLSSATERSMANESNKNEPQFDKEYE